MTYNVGDHVLALGDLGEIVSIETEYEYPYTVVLDEGVTMAFSEDELEAAE